MANRDLHLDFINVGLSKRRDKDQFRTLRSISPLAGPEIELNGQKLLNFCSNDYLGLAKHPSLIEASNNFTSRFGTGSTASRLISGSLDIHTNLERELAQWLGEEAALLFNAGYQANSSIIPALAGPKSLIVADKLCHNSMIAGIKQSGAKFLRYRHNDLDHLKQLLDREAEHAYDRI